MDAVEHGQAFTVTRDGHSIGELVPLRQRRRFVSRAEFVAMSRTAPAIDTNAFRADQDAAADQARGAYASAGPHEVRSDTEQDVYFEAAERACRLDVLPRAEHEFDPVPFDADAARVYSRVKGSRDRRGPEASPQSGGSHDRRHGDRRRAPAVHDKS